MYKTESIKSVVAIVITMFLIGACNNNRSTEKADLPPSADTTITKAASTKNVDNAAINQTIRQVYKALVYNRTAGFDSAAIKNLFIPQAQFIHFEPHDSVAVNNLNQFLSWYALLMKNRNVDSFVETEVHGRTEQWGKLAERFSSYKTYVNSTDSVEQRGINSFQLIKTKNGWRVASLIWDPEHGGVMLTPEYLKPDDLAY